MTKDVLLLKEETPALIPTIPFSDNAYLNSGKMVTWSTGEELIILKLPPRNISPLLIWACAANAGIINNNATVSLFIIADF